jgi:hypothetical protein
MIIVVNAGRLAVVMDNPDKCMFHLVLVFDPEGYAADTDGKELTVDHVNFVGKMINEEMSHWYGYSGWRVMKDDEIVSPTEDK